MAMQYIKLILLVLGAFAALMAILGAVTALVMFLMASRRQAKKTVTLDRSVFGSYLDEMQAAADWFRGLDTEEVSITSADGLRLVARILPAENPKGTLLLMHGYRSTGVRDFSCILPFYHESGYNILLPDQRACGASEGKYITFGVKEREDCRLWAEYASERFGKDLPLFLDGISMGATTVLMAAGLPLPENVRGIIADCGFTSPMAIIGKVADKVLGSCPKPILRLSSAMAGWIGGWRYDACTTLDAMKQNTAIPVLFSHGEKDDFVPVEMTRENYAACAAPKDIFLVPEAGHGMCYLMERETCQQGILEFLNKYGQA